MAFPVRRAFFWFLIRSLFSNAWGPARSRTCAPSGFQRAACSLFRKGPRPCITALPRVTAGSKDSSLDACQVLHQCLSICFPRVNDKPPWSLSCRCDATRHLGRLPPSDSGLGLRAPQPVPVGREVAFHSRSALPHPQPLLLMLAGQILRNRGLFASRLQASCLKSGPSVCPV